MRRCYRLLCLVLLAALAACQPAEPPKRDFKGTEITGVNFGGDFTLTAHDGRKLALSDLRGKVVALFFGYTHCPDVCPTTMMEYAAAVRTLGADADRVQVLFVTVDPERDTRAVLAGYVPYFNKGFLGLSGSRAETDKVMQQFRIVARKVGGEHGAYTIDHSAGSYLFDTEGRLRVYEPYGAASAMLAHDIREMLR